MVDAFRIWGEEWEILDPSDPDLIQKSEAFDGFVISGSELSVVEDRGNPIVDNLIDLIRDIYQSRSSPMIGICFGSQAIAMALGGSVGKNPDKRFRLGIEELKWTAEALGTDWPEVSEAVSVVASHGECVTVLPSGATSLASSNSIPHEMFMVGNKFLGIQGHPEVTNEMLRSMFMKVHRNDFDEFQWKQVEYESTLPLNVTPLKTMCRRLLATGCLR